VTAMTAAMLLVTTLSSVVTGLTKGMTRQSCLES
jgi:hypothetical protein